MTLARAVRIGLRLVVFAGLIFAALHLSDWVQQRFEFVVMPHTETMVYRAMLLAVLVYMILMATPFLPGAEIGLALLTGMGASVAPLVYCATVLALVFTYSLGLLVPPETTARGLERMGFRKAPVLLRRVGAVAPEARLALVLEETGKPWLRHGSRYRYLALAMLLNMPGNVVLGGGGGLALVAGLSQVFRPLAFVTTVALAVLPVPLFVFLMG